MFPHEQGPQDSSLLRRHSLPPLRLPKQQSHLKSVGSSIAFRNQNIDNSRYLQNTLSEHQRYRFLNQRPRAGSFDEESVYPRTMLPSMASLMPWHSFQFQHDNSFNSAAARQHSHRQVSCLEQVSSARQQTLSHERTHLPMASVTTTASNLQVRRGLPTPFPGLSAFPIQPIEMQRNRFAVPLSNRLTRWSPYASTWVSVARGSFCNPIAISWKDGVDQNKQQNPQRRRTSPRRRIEASKARDQAFRMQELAEVFGDFENNRIGYGLAKKNGVGPSPRFFSTLSRELPLPMLQSPIFINDANTSPTNRDSRYRDRRTIFGCLDCGERQSALAEEFRATRAAMNKYREHVLPHQLNDPLAKHPNESRHTKMSADEMDSEDAAPFFQHQSNRISLLWSGDTLRHCKNSRL